MTRRRRLLLVLAGLAALPIGAAAIAWWRFDPAMVVPRVTAAVERATGRKLDLGGPVRLALLPRPAVTLDEVSFANAPGGSQPAMLRIRRVELEVALWPLLARRVELRRLVLTGPDLLLETDGEGHPNWVFARPAPAAPPPDPVPTAAPAAPRRLDLGIDSAVLREGSVTWRNGVTGAVRRLDLVDLTGSAPGVDAPLRFAGTVALEGRPIAVTGEASPPRHLLDPVPGTPFALRATAAAAGARLALDASIADPRARRGWRAAITAQAPDLTALAPWLPDVPLPTLREVDLAATLVDAGPGRQALASLRLAVGASPLDPLWRGLALRRLTAELSAPDAPLRLAAEATLGGQALTLAGTTGAPAAAGPLPIDLTVTGAGATARLAGAIAEPRQMRGVDLAATLAMPDLAAAGAPFGLALPALRDLRAAVRLAERGPFFSGGAELRDIAIESSAGDVAGALSFVIGMRAGLHGVLASRRLDLDALRLPALPPAPPGAPAAAAAPATPPDRRVIPATPLPLGPLRLTDSEIRWTVERLRRNGVDATAVAATLAIRDGRGRLDPLTFRLDDAPIALRAAADITQDPPAVEFAARGTGVDVARLLALLGVPGAATGEAGFDTALRGRGGDWRALAATLDGRLGLTLMGAEVAAGPGSGLGRLGAGLPPGSLPARLVIGCGALRLGAEAGRVRVETLLLEGPLGRLGGGGTADLREERLALTLNVDARLQGIRLRAPVPVTGRFAAPRVEAGPALLGGAADRLLGEAAGGLAGLFGGGGGGAPIPDCAAARAAATR